MNSYRITKAILLAPLSVFPILAIPMLFLAPFWLGFIVGLYAVLIAYVGMVIVGIPSIYLCQRLQATRWWQLTLAGALGGASVGLLEDHPVISTLSMYGGGLGAVVAVTAWFIAFRSSTDDGDNSSVAHDVPTT